MSSSSSSSSASNSRSIPRGLERRRPRFIPDRLRDGRRHARGAQMNFNHGEYYLDWQNKDCATLMRIEYHEDHKGRLRESHKPYKRATWNARDECIQLHRHDRIYLDGSVRNGYYGWGEKGMTDWVWTRNGGRGEWKYRPRHGTGSSASGSDGWTDPGPTAGPSKPGMHPPPPAHAQAGMNPPPPPAAYVFVPPKKRKDPKDKGKDKAAAVPTTP